MRGLIVRTMAVALALAITGTGGLAQNNSKPDKSTDDAIVALKKLLTDHPELIDYLKKLLEQGQKEKGVPTPVQGEPPIPTVGIPGGEQAPPIPQPGVPSTAQPVTRASLAPDISVIGNNLGRFFSARGDKDRNRLQLGEFEIGLQQRIYPGIRFDAFLTGDAEEGFGISAEEAYATFSQLGHLPIGAYLGKKRLDIGKINPVHPHARNYADQPAVVNYFLGGDGLGGNGASANYTLPVKELFANLELGLWKVDPAGEGFISDGGGLRPRSRIANGAFYPIGLGVDNNFALSRLWTSHAFNKANELEFGASHGFGRADIGDRINLTGLDLTYRNFPATFKRLMLQGEVFWHHRNDVAGGTGGHTRSGHYVLLDYRPDQYTSWGLRFDNTRLPWPFDGREQSFSLIWTDRLTEVTLLRMQLKYGDRTNDVFLPFRRNYTEAWLQFLWGGGSHTHQIQ